MLWKFKQFFLPLIIVTEWCWFKNPVAAFQFVES